MSAAILSLPHYPMTIAGYNERLLIVSYWLIMGEGRAPELPSHRSNIPMPPAKDL